VLWQIRLRETCWIPNEPSRASPAQACQLGCEGIVVEATRLTVPFRPIQALCQGQEPGGAGSAARSGRGLGALTHLVATRACASGKGHQEIYLT
jgi:hypothetical protein